MIILAASRFARLQLPLGTLLGLTAVVGVTNLVLHVWLRTSARQISTAWSGSVLAFDMAQLTALLYVTGGAANPFSVFYLVQITAAAVTLGSGWTWGLTMLGVSAYAALFALPLTPTAAASAHAAHDFANHLRTMWVALTLAAALTAFFVTRLTTGLARRDREILAMREASARRERLSALTTLAAGAAHELGTPLTTVAVVAGELERAMSLLPPGPVGRLAEDVQLIRAEVARCRYILDEIGAESGHASGEMPTTFTAGALVGDVLARLRPEAASRVRATAEGGERLLFLPRRALARVTLSLVQNGLDASPDGHAVTVNVTANEALEIRVHDDGEGMTPDVASRAGEPFFTTKPPGQGLGLGLFLARSLAEQLGGRLEMESIPSRGTTVCLALPLRVHVDAEPT